MRRPRKPRDPFGKAFDPFAKGGKKANPPAPRRQDLEDQLCAAIADKRLVLMLYGDDRAERLYAPYAVYYSTADPDRVLVTGTQIDNPGDPLDKYVPRNFEVGRISGLTVTDTKFQRDARFDRHDSKFDNGIICCIDGV